MVLQRALKRRAHHRAKGDGVHPDMVRRQRHGHRPGHLVQRRAGHRIGQKLGLGPARGDRRQVDDGSRRGPFVTGLFALLDHAATKGLRDPQRGHQVLLEKPRHGVVVGIQRVGGHHLPAGVHQDVDPVEGVERGREQVRDGQLLAQVAGEGAGPFGIAAQGRELAVQRILVDVGEHHVGAARQEVAGDRKAHAVAGAGDHGGLSFNGKGHSSASSLAARARGAEEFVARVGADLVNLDEGFREGLFVGQMPVGDKPERPLT